MTGVSERSRGSQIQLAEEKLVSCEQASGKDSLDLSPVIQELASLYHHDGLYAKAELLYRRLIDILTPANSSPELVSAYHRLGMLYRSEGKYGDAEAVYLRALKLAESSGGTVECLTCLAGLYVQKNDFASAISYLEQVARALEDAKGSDNIDLKFCYLALASVYQWNGQVGQAEECYQRSLTSTAAADDERTALLQLSQLYYKQQRFAEVGTLLNQTVFSDESKLWPDNPRVAQSLHDRGELFLAQGQHKGAETAFKQALSLRQQVLGASHPAVAETAFSLTLMYLSQSRLSEAEPVLKRALTTRVLAFGVEHPSVAACIETYVVLLKRTKRIAIAGKLEARARDIRSRLVWEATRSS